MRISDWSSDVCSSDLERARTNHGATLIEFFTYRAAGHSTSDDPTKYRPADEAEHWPLGDPIERLKQNLIRLREWDEDRHAALGEELNEKARTAATEGEAVGGIGQSRPNVRERWGGGNKE